MAGALSRTPDGRHTTFETRMAMQRELDAARAQLKAAERQCDELRRQAVASREESAVFRAENIRLQDEFYSVKSRLGQALEGQQELQRKHHELQQDQGDARHVIAGLEDDLAAKDATIAFLKVRRDMHGAAVLTPALIFAGSPLLVAHGWDRRRQTSWSTSWRRRENMQPALGALWRPRPPWLQTRPPSSAAAWRLRNRTRSRCVPPSRC